MAQTTSALRFRPPLPLLVHPLSSRPQQRRASSLFRQVQYSLSVLNGPCLTRSFIFFVIHTVGNHYAGNVSDCPFFDIVKPSLKIASANIVQDICEVKGNNKSKRFCLVPLCRFIKPTLFSQRRASSTRPFFKNKL